MSPHSDHTADAAGLRDLSEDPAFTSPVAPPGAHRRPRAAVGRPTVVAALVTSGVVLVGAATLVDAGPSGGAAVPAADGARTVTLLDADSSPAAGQQSAPSGFVASAATPARTVAATPSGPAGGTSVFPGLAAMLQVGPLAASTSLDAGPGAAAGATRGGTPVGISVVGPARASGSGGPAGAPQAPVAHQPAPSGPAPHAPAPYVPAPHAPAPHVPAPQAPVVQVPVPRPAAPAPAPAVPAPSRPVPTRPVPVWHLPAPHRPVVVFEPHRIVIRLPLPVRLPTREQTQPSRGGNDHGSTGHGGGHGRGHR